MAQPPSLQVDSDEPMWSLLPAYATGNVVVILVALGLTKATASVLKTWIEEISCTRRLEKALENTSPRHRSEIIKACSQLENHQSKDLSEEPDNATPTAGRVQDLPLRITKTDHDT
jgi:hypothetical protein